MKIHVRSFFIQLILIFSFCESAFAASETATHGSNISALLLALLTILLVGKIGAAICGKIKQPEVLGELIIGIVLGNFLGSDFLHNSALELLSELGIILLLFEVGIETDLKEMSRVGTSSLLVAVLGVVTPFALGFGVSYLFLPSGNLIPHVFIGATLTATSVGITARVLKDLGKLHSSEAQIVLGAAVIDDVLGLLVLGVVTGIITSINVGSAVEVFALIKIILSACGFLVLAVGVGSYISPFCFRLASRIEAHGLLLTISLMICFLFSYLASLVGLAPIVGAFTAGLILEPVHYKALTEKKGSRDLKELISPLVNFLAPMFFVLMGTRVDLSVFLDTKILIWAFVLTFVAAVGKQACALGVLGKGIDRIVVGLAMIPRGEVGLIFASIGAGLTINGQPVIDRGSFGAVIIMVIVTTLVTPVLVKWRFSKLAH